MWDLEKVLPEAGFDKEPKSPPPHQQLPSLPAQAQRGLFPFSQDAPGLKMTALK